MTMIDATHDPALHCWVESARKVGTDFPIQNLPFGRFRPRGSSDDWRSGVAIGDMVVDVGKWLHAGLVQGLAAEAAAAATSAIDLKPLAKLGRPHWRALRAALSNVLSSRTPAAEAVAGIVPIDAVELALPVLPENYTDFFCSLEHATTSGRAMRPGQQPVHDNFRWMPIAYHGRASSVRVSGVPCVRPFGQIRENASSVPIYRPTLRLDYEAELGCIVGPGNRLGQQIPIDEAEDHLFGLCLLNDWSARDIQRFEYQPLGPFLGKSFLTTISPWIVTLEALAPFRAPARQRAGDEEPHALSYLSGASNDAAGGFNIEISAALSTSTMRKSERSWDSIGRANARLLYWTPAQMLTHHASNGCDLHPGDLLGTGTISGLGAGEAGCLLEATANGQQPIRLSNGESRSFLLDGDIVRLTGRCERNGYIGIGFGECLGMVQAALGS
jgi:fumarylacetoacetase